MKNQNHWQIHKDRLAKVQSKLNASEILLVFGAKHKIRNRDVEYKFRQDSDFYYLTGINESDSILFVTKDSKGMFCLPKDKEREIWTGVRLGKQKIKNLLGFDLVFDLHEWQKEIPNLLLNNRLLYHFFGYDSKRDLELLELCRAVSNKARDGKVAPTTIAEPTFLHEMRRTKSQDEIINIQDSARITKNGHLALFRETRIGMYEFELESILEREYLKEGAWGGGYGHIVASGVNACVLHYVENNSQIKKNDLILVDSGAEKGYYTADVTRVFPAGKEFTEPQKIIYEIVLASQKNAIQLAKKGVLFQDIHLKTVRFLTDCLIDLGFLKGSLDFNIEKGHYKQFYMHKTGHFLGMDVHDVGSYFQEGKSMPLQDGQVITVEPGIYIDPKNTKVPPEFRGIGIRIEDDILINGNSPINLTGEIPKEIDEIEELRREAYSDSK